MKRKFISLVLGIFIPFATTQAQWVQIGNDIDGAAAGDYAGWAVSVNSDGSVIAVGAPRHSGSGDWAGHVRVYNNQGGTWVQTGADLNGEAEQDNFGYSISLNADGSVLAVGSPYNSGNGFWAGHVRIYEKQNGGWVQTGDDIDGAYPNAGFGSAVSLSADGLVVAIGANGNAGTGYAAFYENTGGTWTPKGDTIYAEVDGSRFGHAISLSSDGSIVAIGAPNNPGNGIMAGNVRVFELQDTVWVQIGADIDGEAEGDKSGTSVSLSADGSILAIGAPRNDGNGSSSGHVRIFENDNGTWTQVGDDIDGETADSQSGISVSLSSDGTIVAIGGHVNSGNGHAAGHVRIFQNQGGNWTQIGEDIDGEGLSDWSGWSVSLNSGGTIVAIGAFGNDGTGLDAGHARVFGNNISPCTPSTAAFSVSACDSYTVPSGDETYTTSGTYQDTIPNSAGCDSVMTITVTVNTVDVSVTVTSPTLTANAAGATYQWLDCQNGLAAIQGETSQSFTATTSGSYAVEVTQNKCTDTSSCFGITVSITALEENDITGQVTVYPNPNGGMISIDLGNLKNVSLRVTDINGKLILKRNKISGQNYQFDIPPTQGIYFIEVTDGKRHHVFRLLKE